MPRIQGWFRSSKSLSTRQRLQYYEDVYSEKNADEDLQGIHILAEESDTAPEILGGKGIRRARNKNKSAIRIKFRNNGKAKVMETAAAEETVTSETANRTTVVTIDDDIDDVHELFVADMGRYAQTVIDESNEDNNDEDIPADLQNQEQIYDAFFQEIRRYAQPLENNEPEEEDEILTDINGKAKQFSAPSPLGSRVEYSPDVQQTQNDENALRSTEAPDDSAVISTTEVPKEPAVIASTETPNESAVMHAADGTDVLKEADLTTMTEQRTKRVRFEMVVRAHSWDSSQGSNYVYSDDGNQYKKRHAASNQISNKVVKHNERQNDDHQTDEFQNDEPGEAKLMKRQSHDKNGTQIGELGRTGSETSDDLDQSSSQPIDLTPPARSEGSEDETTFLDSRQSSKLTIGQTSDEADPFISPKSHGDPDRRRRRRFGMFASQPVAADHELIINLTEEELPRKESFRSMLKKRRRAYDHKDTPTVPKRSRYNLRPRNEVAASSDGGIRGEIQASPLLEPDDELKASNPRRETRSMSAKKEKKVVPRHKTARKSAWTAMGLTMEKETSRQRQKVQVVIPVVDIDRSAYQSVPSSHQKERRESEQEKSEAEEIWPKYQSSITASNQSRFGKHDERSARAGKARKRFVAGKEVLFIDSDSEGDGESVPRSGRSSLEMVLID